MSRSFHLAGFQTAGPVTHSHSAWRHPKTTGDFEDFVDRVVPELQRRGRFREDYTGSRLRDHPGLGEASLTPVPRQRTAASAKLG